MAEPADRIETLFCAALALATPEERAEYLAGQCGDDVELRRTVENLLGAHERAGRFLEHPLLEHSAATLVEDYVGRRDDLVGTTIGRYKLLEAIGEGGFATVYMAEQAEPVTRRVAVKVMKAGMDSGQIVARFEAERQALAMMDHPHIAKVFDGGATSTGRPYFVMELVKGRPITDYCDESRMSVEARLQLFILICQAVEHAHQKGIIHRDLKPGNVLVSTRDDRPMPQIIDFGIAKATGTRLTDKTLFTDFRQLIGTPAYMSPEQAEGSLDIDTRSDVYSLGVLLYELLAGAPPFDPRELQSKALAEMQRILREVDPPTPSTRLSTMEAGARTVKAEKRQLDPQKFVERLRGELDWIVMRSLEKNRARRYQSPSALAEEIRRFLGHEPVEARPATAGYRLRKFARRNKGLLTAVTLIGLTLVVATGVSTWQAVRASRAQQQTLAEARRAEAVTEFLVEAFRSPDPDRDGRTVTIVEVLDRAAAELEPKFADQPLVKATLLHTLGTTYISLGLPEKAIPLLEQGWKLRKAHLGESHKETLATMAKLARQYSQIGQYDDAVALSEEHLRLQQNAHGDESLEAADGMALLSGAYRQCRRANESIPLAAGALKIYQDKLGTEHARTLAMMHEHLCAIGQATGEGHVVSVPYQFVDILKLAEAKFGKDDTFYLLVKDNTGYGALHRGQLDYASEIFTSLVETWTEKLGPESVDARRAANLLAQVAQKHVDPRKGMRDVELAERLVPGRPQVEAARKEIEARLGAVEEMADDYIARIRRARDEPWALSARKAECCRLAQIPDVFALVAERLPDESALWIGNGQDHLWRGQFQQAEKDYARVIHERPLQDEHYEYGYLLLLRGDSAAYQKFCQQQLDRSGPPRHGYQAYVAARLHSAGPATCITPGQLVEWAELAARDRHRWQTQALGLAYLRAGRFEEAIAAYKEGIVNEAARHDTAENWYGLAIANHLLGNKAKAQHCLEQARMGLRNAAPPRDGERAYVDVPSSWVLIRWYAREAEEVHQIGGGLEASPLEAAISSAAN